MKNCNVKPGLFKFSIFSGAVCLLLNTGSLSAQNITGAGTAGNLLKFTGISTAANSLVFDNGTNVSVLSPNNAAPLTTVPTNSAFSVGSTVTNLALNLGLFSNGGSNPYCWIQSRNNGVANTFYGLSLQPLGGNVGIGVTAPEDKLQINSGITKMTFGSAYGPGTGYGTSYLGFNLSRAGALWLATGDGANNGAAMVYGDVSGGLRFMTASTSGPSNQTIPDAQMVANTRMYITGGGNIGIGTTQPGSFKLAVEGKIGAREIQVLVGAFPDYVFEKNYSLMSIEEVEKFITANKHLPNIPSAAEVKQNGGINVGELQLKQIEKLEELYLYVIELKHENEKLKKDIAGLTQTR